MFFFSIDDEVLTFQKVELRGETKFEIRTLSVNPKLRFDPPTPQDLSVNPAS